MKKIISTIFLLTVVVACLLAFASCGTEAVPNTNPKVAVEALIDDDYTIIENAKDYGSYIFVKARCEEDYISIWYFDDAKSAVAQYDILEEEYKAAIDKGYEVSYEFGIFGTVVYYGTSDAIETAAG